MILVRKTLFSDLGVESSSITELILTKGLTFPVSLVGPRDNYVSKDNPDSQT